MRIAFYAPLKPPDHPVPSGDRTVARLWLRLLRQLGHEADTVCRLRTWDGGNPARMARLDALGRRAATLLEHRFAQGRRPRPQLWFTYHPYPKAPDPLGPELTPRLGIPLVVAEASLSPKQAQGVFAHRHAATRRLLALADLVLAPARRDLPGLAPHIRPPARLVHLPPFLDTVPHAAALTARAHHRRTLAARLALDPECPWLLAVGMMRPGVKHESWRLLAQALAQLQAHRFHLLAVGDGPMRPAVAAALAPLGGRLRTLGALSPEALPALYAASDLLVWPGVGEAYGMVYLEAQAAGLPVVAGRFGGVEEVVAGGPDHELVAAADALAFAAAIARRLARGCPSAADRRRIAAATAARHGLEVAARRVGPLLEEAVRIHRARGRRG